MGALLRPLQSFCPHILPQEVSFVPINLID